MSGSEPGSRSGSGLGRTRIWSRTRGLEIFANLRPGVGPLPRNLRSYASEASEAPRLPRLLGRVRWWAGGLVGWWIGGWVGSVEWCGLVDWWSGGLQLGVRRFCKSTLARATAMGRRIKYNKVL